MTVHSDPSQKSTVDWDNMAEVFDRWLPYIQPVADALIDLADIRRGNIILDVASGTGEPSLTLARRFRDHKLSVIGVDGAEAMVTRANKKVAQEKLKDLTFQQMKAEDLSFPSGMFDRVISRFGVMLFDDPLRGVVEMRRVLKDTGKMAVAVWGAFEKIRSMYLIWDILIKAMPQEKRPPVPKIGALGPPGALESLLDAAGFKEIAVRPFIVTYRFDDFESYWEVNTSAGLLKEPLDTFSLSQQEIIKKETETLAEPYQTHDGLVFQNEALLAFATK